MKKNLNFAAVVIIVITLLAGSYFWQKSSDEPMSQEDAIKQAKEFKPEGNCTQALVPATHSATGAKYTFGSGCLAPGWVAGQ